LKKFDYSKYGGPVSPLRPLIKKFYKKNGDDEISGLEFFESLEKDFKCSSVCKPQMFYILHNITEGMPTEDCIEVV